jgi:hypothetical protein
MDFRQLDRGELVAALGGVILAVSLFLGWYRLGDKFAVLGTCRGPNSSCSAWKSLMILRCLLVVAAAAPVVLAPIILRGHALSWPGEVSVDYGWWIAVVGGLLILIGSVWRTRESAAVRRPLGMP